LHAASSEKRATAVWLEWSKMEEENGRSEDALNILILGLMVCKQNDTLLPRLIKLHERFHHYEEIRSVLSSMKNETVDKTWKSILEGCLFEGRLGNVQVSFNFLKFLMKYVSWYGPIYYEAFLIEEQKNELLNALSIIKRGLSELPRYGPLWFGLLRLMELDDVFKERRFWQKGMSPQFRNLRFYSNDSLKSISKELTWR
jgi:hypothetical protein